MLLLIATQATRADVGITTYNAKLAKSAKTHNVQHVIRDV
jgi:hypothetical protein